MTSFWFRLRRKLGLKVRQRCLPVYERFDRRAYSAALGEEEPRQVLLRFAGLAPWLRERASAISTWVDADESLAIRKAADRVCAHVFDLLGSGETFLGDKIDWHSDFKSSYRWELVHHASISWGDLPDGVDIKVPWELSRCLHFASLGLADRISGEDRYYGEFKRQVRDWIAANPYDRGVNWACAMDVGIRAVNWLNAIMLFEHRLKNDSDADFSGEILESLWLHGLHIRRNLEWRGPKVGQLGNHFVANLTGLLGIGCLFRSTQEGEKQWNFASEWLEREIDRQVFADGSNYETSTSYHRLVLEMFVWSASLAESSGRPFSEKYRAVVGKMMAFVEAYSSPSGDAAQFGDNDSGRLLAVGIEGGADHRYLAEEPSGFGGVVNRMLLCCREGWSVARSIQGNQFPDGGFWFLSNERGWLGFRAGVVSHGGAHSHCDQLSFVLSVDGQDFIVDRGTGLYSPDVGKRNQYRSTFSHNVLQINDWEMNSSGEGRFDIFRLKDDTKTEACEVSERHARAKHHGFTRFRAGLVCEREVALNASRLVVTDQVEALAVGDRLEWSFHFAPDVEVREKDGGIVATKGDSKIELVCEPELAVRIEGCMHSPAYGVEQTASTVRVRCDFQSGMTNVFTTRISW